MSDIKKISAEQFRAYQKDPTLCVIDVRDRQEFAAGSVVLLGIVGSTLVHPALNTISTFVACSLIFAGITDLCGLGLLMMKMPWNQSK
jgi:hypothetical protein